MACRPSTSTSSVRWPPAASASASAAATVVLPVPPLPVTTCRRAGHPGCTGAPLITCTSWRLPAVAVPARVRPGVRRGGRGVRRGAGCGTDPVLRRRLHVADPPAALAALVHDGDVEGLVGDALVAGDHGDPHPHHHRPLAAVDHRRPAPREA